ncbi:MAG: hypothetical protein ABIR67_08880 [Gaiellaceae bacterium]
MLAMGVPFAASTALADPNLTDVPRHKHFVETPSGKLVQVGPRFCDDPSLQDAFNQFHFNIHHHGFPGYTGPPSLGPQDGAPGLYNDLGAEITARGCAFPG